MPFDTRNNAFEYASPFEYSNEPNLIITNLDCSKKKIILKTQFFWIKSLFNRTRQHLKNAICSK